jgi:hypothetical protein
MKPFDEGQRAFKRGNLVNPYNPETSRYRDWQFGFDRAYFDNLERVKEREARNGKAQKENSA